MRPEAEVELKMVDERNVLIVCLCQLWPSGILFLFSPSPVRHARHLKLLFFFFFQATGLQLLLG